MKQGRICCFLGTPVNGCLIGGAGPSFACVCLAMALLLSLIPMLADKVLGCLGPSSFLVEDTLPWWLKVEDPPF